jgi:hypothetical protein
MAAPAPCIGYAFDILINLHITGMIESPITAMIHTAAFLYIIFFFPAFVAPSKYHTPH